VSFSSRVWGADATSQRSNMNGADASRRPFQGSRTDLRCVSVQIFEFPGGKKSQRTEKRSRLGRPGQRLRNTMYSEFLGNTVTSVHSKEVPSRPLHRFVSFMITLRYACEMSGPMRLADFARCERSGPSDDVPFV